MSSPICSMQMINADIYNAEEYDGTIIFHRETEISAEEQLLCTAAAIVFVNIILFIVYNLYISRCVVFGAFLQKVVMKRKTTMEDGAGKACGYGMGIALVILVIVAFVIWIQYLEKGQCLRRKAAGYGGYVDRDC